MNSQAGGENNIYVNMLQHSLGYEDKTEKQKQNCECGSGTHLRWVWEEHVEVVKSNEDLRGQDVAGTSDSMALRNQHGK